MTSFEAEKTSGQIIVVVAEDEDVLRSLAVDFLTDAGFLVIEASHAAAALHHLETHGKKIHVLFTDIRMPGEMDGLALAHYVKRHWPQIALLLASGDGSAHPRKLPEGSRFIPKPYMHDHVVDQIRTLVEA